MFAISEKISKLWKKIEFAKNVHKFEKCWKLWKNIFMFSKKYLQMLKKFIFLKNLQKFEK